jgi:hypothetical protein
MSRIGNKIINIPDGVTFNINNSVIDIKGPKGSLLVPFHHEMEVKDDNDPFGPLISITLLFILKVTPSGILIILFPILVIFYLNSL